MTIQDYILINNIQKASTADMLIEMASMMTYGENIFEIWRKIKVIRQLQKLFDSELLKDVPDLEILNGCVEYINYLLGDFKRPGSVVIVEYIVLIDGVTGQNVLPELNFKFTQLTDAPNTIEPLKFLRGNALGTRLEFVDIPEPEPPILTEDIPVSNPDLGLTLPYTFLQGTTLTDAWKKLTQKIFEPQLIAPTFSISNNAGLREIGQTFDITLTFNFNRGRINGKNVGGVWVPTELQDFRAGAAQEYVLSGESSGTSNSRTFSTIATQGINSFSGTVQYLIGPQPLNSDDENFSTPLAAGTSPTQTTSFEGVYPLFATSSSITSATKQALVSMLNANNVQITLVAETGGNKQFFDIPDAWLLARPLVSVQYFNTLSGQWDTTNRISEFSITTVSNSVQGNSVSYKRYTYTGIDRGSLLIRLIF